VFVSFVDSPLEMSPSACNGATLEPIDESFVSVRLSLNRLAAGFLILDEYHLLGYDAV
jgi:hypothetical protein